MHVLSNTDILITNKNVNIMELSTTFTKTAKKLGVSEQFVIMADLMAIGYSENDAYTIAYPENATYSIQQNNSIRANVLKTAKFKKLLADTKQRLRDKMGDPSTIEDINLIGSDEVAKEILLSAYKQPKGSKERADLLSRYQDLINKRDEKTTTQESAMQFYLPVCCDKCPLMIKYKEQKRKEKNEQ